MEIESYTTMGGAECCECGGTIPARKGAKLFQIVLADGGGIEGPFCSQKCVDKHQRRDAEAEARIRLHEAAPDLLAACEAIIAVADSDSRHIPLRLQDAIERGRDAIAKATGEPTP